MKVIIIRTPYMPYSPIYRRISSSFPRCVTSVLITVITLVDASHRRNTRRRVQSRLRCSNIFFHPSLKFYSKLHSLQLSFLWLKRKHQDRRVMRRKLKFCHFAHARRVRNFFFYVWYEISHAVWDSYHPSHASHSLKLESYHYSAYHSDLYLWIF